MMYNTAASIEWRMDDQVRVKQKPRILVADDERAARMTLEAPLRLSGYEVVTVSDGREAMEISRREPFDLVLSDVFMQDIGGLELVRQYREINPSTPIILMTAQGSLETAVEAVEQGAYDFIAKPFKIDEVLALVERALSRTSGASPAREDEDEAIDLSATGLVGRSPQIVRVYKLIAHAARTTSTVLITGESGTGKELVAQAIHQHSPRRARPFTAVNCASLTDTLLEAELFGYTKGSFTGATTDRAGLFESTDGGTIFLDELSSTSAALQSSLLRVLQQREVRRVGSRDPISVDVRVIAATNRDLEAMAARGEFRQDLFYRLGVLTISMPPLRERQEDIELLIKYFTRRASERIEHHVEIAPAALEVLLAYPWPGNVRELENTIEQAGVICRGGVIHSDDLPERIRMHVPEATCAHPSFTTTLSIEDRPTLEEIERRYVKLILAETSGNKTRAAEILGIDRRTLQRLTNRESRDKEEG